MKEKDLKQSGVLFDEETHIYTFDGKRLYGVTPIVKWMYPETYNDVPEATLQTAAARGTAIHAACQMYNTIGITSEEWEVTEYVRLTAKKGLKPLASEYIVSDFEQLASPIDVVFEDGSLGDIKCTSELHWANVTLQLNIYRYFFEQMNKDVTIPHLYVIWLPKKQYGVCGIHELTQWDKEFTAKIVEAYKNGKDAAPYRKEIEKNYAPMVVPSKVVNISVAYKILDEKIKTLLAKKEEMQSAVLKAMKEYGAKSWDTDKVKFTRLLPTVRQTVDTKKLKELHPDIYIDCLKDTVTKEGVKITVKEV